MPWSDKRDGAKTRRLDPSLIETIRMRIVAEKKENPTIDVCYSRQTVRF